MRITFGGINTLYEHVKFIMFHQIRFLINFSSCEFIQCTTKSIYIQFTARSEMFGLILGYSEDNSQGNMKVLVFQFPRQVGTTNKDELLKQLCGLISNANSTSDKVSMQPQLCIIHISVCYCWNLCTCMHIKVQGILFCACVLQTHLLITAPIDFVYRLCIPVLKSGGTRFRYS